MGLDTMHTFVQGFSNSMGDTWDGTMCCPGRDTQLKSPHILLGTYLPTFCCQAGLWRTSLQPNMTPSTLVDTISTRSASFASASSPYLYAFVPALFTLAGGSPHPSSLACVKIATD